MSSPALRRSAFALFLWLSLAVVLAPALDPIGSPFGGATGSAFSAFTKEVSLGPARAAAPERDRKNLALPAGGDARSGILADAAQFFPFAVFPLLRVAPESAFQALPLRRLTGIAARAFRARAPPLLLAR
jgi:hypothetical protein